MFTIKKIAVNALLISAGAMFGANSAWALLPIQHWTEANGAQVWLVESPVIPMVDVQLDFDAGSRRDPAEQAGLAAAVASMASKGVLAMPAAGADAGATPALDENALGEAWAEPEPFDGCTNQGQNRPSPQTVRKTRSQSSQGVAP